MPSATPQEIPGYGNNVSGENALVVAFHEPIAEAGTPLPEHADVVNDRVSIIAPTGAVYAREADGRIKTDPDTGAPIYAKDENGVNMVGPIALAWKPGVYKVYTSTEDEEGNLVSSALKTSDDKDVMVGAFVGAGGGGADYIEGAFTD